MPRRVPDTCRLLFGPYRPPKLRVGARTVCLYRDTDVIITSWTDAPISWPRCRAVDSRGPGSGLLVDEELARAVRHESAKAIKFWWGASTGAVWRWRKALGVSQWGTEGSRRLHQASSEKGAAAMRAREFTEAERERKREINRDLNLSRNLRPGFHRDDRWTAKELALLGRFPDREVARRTGRTCWAVLAARHARGIPAYTGKRRRERS